MKKIIVVLLFLIISIPNVYAKNHSIKFNGEKYSLLYSVKSKDFGGYLNEYYKRGETYNIWSEMVAVHHFPNAYSPIDRIKDFKEYLASINVPSSLTFDDKKNTAIIDFIMIADQKLPVVLEFNIFKYEKSKKSGSVAVQYTKRYAATTTMQIEEIKKSFEKERKKMLKIVKNFKIPSVVPEEIDKCISGLDVNEQIKNPVEKNTSNIIENAENRENPDVKSEDAEVENTDVEDVENDKENSELINEEEKSETVPMPINSEETQTEQQSELNSEDIQPEDENNDAELNVNNIEESENLNDDEQDETDNIIETKEQHAQENIEEELNEESFSQEIESVLENTEEFIEQEENSESAPIKEEEAPKDIDKQDNVSDSDNSAENEAQVNEPDNEGYVLNPNGSRYRVTHDSSEYVAKPRTKKEMKKYVKNQRDLRRAKARVKEVEKRLAE